MGASVSSRCPAGTTDKVLASSPIKADGVAALVTSSVGDFVREVAIAV